MEKIEFVRTYTVEFGKGWYQVIEGDPYGRPNLKVKPYRTVKQMKELNPGDRFVRLGRSWMEKIRPYKVEPL